MSLRANSGGWRLRSFRGRDAGDDGVGGHVTGHDRAGGDDGTVAHHDLRLDLRVVAEPGVVADDRAARGAVREEAPRRPSASSQ